MESLLISLNAVTPFFVYLAMGFAARRSGITDEAFLGKLNRVIFRMFFPFVMFANLYKTKFEWGTHAKLIIFGVCAVLLLIAVIWAVVPVFVRENPRRGVMIQALFRSNAILYALPLTRSVCGDEGAAMASLLIAFIVPVYNVTSVIVLEFYRGGKISPARLGRNLITNPILLGAVAGIAMAYAPFPFPVFLEEPVSVFAALATPMALFVLGGSLHFSAVRKNLACLSVVLIVKLVVVPALILLAMRSFSFSFTERFALLSIFATPVATASYPMAAGMEGDAELAGQIVVATTLFSVFTLFVWILIVVRAG